MSKLGNTPGSWRVPHDRIPPHLARILHPKVLKLAAKGLGPVGVARHLSAEYQLSVCPGTVRHWMVGDRKPGETTLVMNTFKWEPSPALSYIIGANKGDGCTMTKSGIVKLEVADREFAEAFNHSMATLFSRSTPNKVLVRRRLDRLPMYIVKYACRQLVRFLRQPLKKLLEFASAYPREFLRGFFDAEGHVSVGVGKEFHLVVGAENSSKPLLLQARRLLMSIGIGSRINRRREAGSIKAIRGVAFVMRRTSYGLVIGKLKDVRRFAREIDFSIPRKTEKLKEAILITDTHAAKDRPRAWTKLYRKERGEWVRKALR
jgi:intein-encoded DNA endonuclease-like protein